MCEERVDKLLGQGFDHSKLEALVGNVRAITGEHRLRLYEHEHVAAEGISREVGLKGDGRTRSNFRGAADRELVDPCFR